jgi:hypothetical protein
MYNGYCWTGFPDERRLFSEDPKTKHDWRRQDVFERQKAAKNDSCDIRVVRHVLLANHYKQNVARIGRLARAKHHRVRPHILDHVHQSDHLRGHELGIPTSIQKPTDV